MSAGEVPMMTSYVGYLASALVLCTFLTRTMMPLRCIALGSNVAFIAYSALLHLYPVLALHCILLPVNAWRLTEIIQLGKSVRETVDDTKVFNALLPFAKRMKLRRGDVLICIPLGCTLLALRGRIMGRRGIRKWTVYSNLQNFITH